MKSFSEYLKEAYSFRLGGSQQKGFEQNKVKSFKELEKGDTIYWYYFNKNNHDNVLNILTVNDFAQSEWEKDAIRIECKDDKGKCFHFNVKKDGLDKTTRVEDFYINFSVISTSQTDLFLKLEEIFKEKNINVNISSIKSTTTFVRN